MNWIVGDVHGCALELEDLLGAVRFERGKDVLWSVGDLIRTGPDSLGAMRLWADVGGRAVLGNHDIHGLLVRDGARPLEDRRLEPLLEAPDGGALLERLRSQPLLARVAGDGAGAVWLVHAGIPPAWRDLDSAAGTLHAGGPRDAAWLRRKAVSVATTLRCCTSDGSPCRWTGPPRGCPPPSRPWDAFYGGEATVAHGHWARRGHYRGARTVGLDSGCVYGGALTAWCPEEDRVVQVPARRAWYPAF